MSVPRPDTTLVCGSEVRKAWDGAVNQPVRHSPPPTACPTIKTVWERVTGTPLRSLYVVLSSGVPRVFGGGATTTTTCPFLCPFSTYLWASTISASR